MQLELNEIHVWSAGLDITPTQQRDMLGMLADDERVRAERFRFPIHKQRFIAARAILRQIIGCYLSCQANEIRFAYSEHGKPYLQTREPHGLQFNLAHSHDMAVYAFTLNHAIGIDIEKIQTPYQQAIAERFFSSTENAQLMQMTEAARIEGFYRLWSRKEALIKAEGKGLSIPLSSFSVSANAIPETLTLENQTWSLVPLTILAGFEAALASNQIIKKISYWQLINQSPKLSQSTHL